MKRLRSLLLAAFSCLVLSSFSLEAASKYPYAVQPQNVSCNDTLSVLCIGNSFTYVFETYNMLKEISWSQGHWLQIKTAYVGGYSFACHLADESTIKAIEKTGTPYDHVFLQNQSALNALYAREPQRYAAAKKDAVELSARVRMYSPEAKLYMECTWSYPRSNYATFDSYSQFDYYLQKGSKVFAKACKAEVSPIGAAFAIARESYPEINLLRGDDHHQSLAGAYLKSCVNYLMIFGGQFDDKVSDCSLESDVAQKLRTAALEAVGKAGVR